MPSYDALNDQQKADIARYDTFLRGVFSSLTTVARQADVANWNQFAVSNVDPLLASLDAGETIPTATGLAGAKTLTKEEFAELQTVARQLVTLLESKRALLVKAVGVNTG